MSLPGHWSGLTKGCTDGSGEDHYGAPIVRDSASLWGIDSLEDGY